MKAWGLLILLVLFSLPAFADVTKAMNVLQKMNKNVVAIGQGGEVIIYYKEGDEIVVKNCGKNYAVVTKREDCVGGAENRVPLRVFKRSLESSFLLQAEDKLKPLTPDEVKAFRMNDSEKTKQLEQKEKELNEKLTNIKAFLESFGEEPTTVADKTQTEKLLTEVRKELQLARGAGDAVNKVNAIISDLIKKLETSDVIRISANKNGNDALFTLLKQYDASRAECGTDEILNSERSAPAESVPSKEAPAAGRQARLMNLWISEAFAQEASAVGFTIEDRIKDCAAISNSSKTVEGVTWNLVARKRDRSTGKFYEVWKDSKSGLVWGDRLDSDYSHHNAVAIAANGKTTEEKVCQDEEGQRAAAKISGQKFGLPTKEEIDQAQKNGIRQVLPNMSGHWFWATTLHWDSSDYAAGLKSGDEGPNYAKRSENKSVRCVARP